MTSRTTLRVLKFLLENKDNWSWGSQISKETKVKIGTTFYILRRYFEDGWLQDRWEGEDRDRSIPRPPRRLYRLTKLGISLVRKEVE